MASEQEWIEMLAEVDAINSGHPARLARIQAEHPDQHWDLWHEQLRRFWPDLGLQATVDCMTFAKGRVRIGPLNSPFVDQNY